MLITANVMPTICWGSDSAQSIPDWKLDFAKAYSSAGMVSRIFIPD